MNLRRLSKETYERYLALEKEGKLTPRQEKALASHRGLVKWSQSMDDPNKVHIPGTERAAMSMIEVALDMSSAPEPEPQDKKNRKDVSKVWQLLADGVSSSEYPNPAVIDALALLTTICATNHLEVSDNRGRKVTFDDDGREREGVVTSIESGEYTLFSDGRYIFAHRSDNAPILAEDLVFHE